MKRSCAALLLGLVFAGAPVTADFCAASCEAAHSASSGASIGHAGHHHHSSVALLRLDQPPHRCGHDHSGGVAVTASSDAAHMQPLTTRSAAAALPVSLMAASLWTPLCGLQSSNSPPGPSVRGFASPIRI